MPPVESESAESGLELVLLSHLERLKETVRRNPFDLCIRYSHITLEMIQIVVGPFAHHTAVEAFWLKLGILGEKNKS